MARKKEGEKGKAKPKSKAIAVEQYENTIATLQKEIERTGEIANLVDTRFTKSLTFWEIAKNLIAELDKELRNASFILDSTEDKQMEEIEKYKMRMRHSLNEAQSKYGELKSLVLLNKKEMIIEFEKDLTLFRNENQALKCKMRERELQDAEFIKSLHLHFQKEQSKKEQDLCSKIELVEAQSKEAIKELRLELDAIRQRDLNEMEEKHGLHVRDLISNHEEQMVRMKHYYNRITSNSIDLIRGLEVCFHLPLKIITSN
ncbi:Dynein regulatory complex subunit 4 [Cichlidogyrus casuarinus]|uniref:Dynein regulatory complex subunit 4 n=1 Tax=Cichlidogyrus casuarinus TaxID=1844966 RepID=A0ABD2PWH7_9PLAT